MERCGGFHEDGLKLVWLDEEGKAAVEYSAKPQAKRAELCDDGGSPQPKVRMRRRGDSARCSGSAAVLIPPERSASCYCSMAALAMRNQSTVSHVDWKHIKPEGEGEML